MRTRMIREQGISKLEKLPCACAYDLCCISYIIIRH